VLRVEVTSYFRINTFWHAWWDTKKSKMTKNMKNSKVDSSNVQPLTNDQLMDADKAKFEAHEAIVLHFIWLD
jgi:hypothetical protein